MPVLTVKEQAQKALALVNKFLEFGPKTPEFTGHLQAGVMEFAAAKDMVVQHFGVSAAIDSELPTFETLVSACPELGEACDKLDDAQGVSAGDNKGIREWITLLLSNPALMTFLMSLLKV